MRPFARCAATLLVAFLLVSRAPAAVPARPGFDPATMLRVSEVKPGEIAVGKTVFKGTAVSTFHLTILGIEKNSASGEDIILAKVTDGPLVLRGVGILSGMSGSPVYVRGKLIGAIAYAWDYQKEAVTGITPIESMLDSWEPAGRALTMAPVTVTIPAHDGITAQPATLRPAGMMAAATGFSPHALRKLSELFEPYGIRVVAAAGGGTTTAPYSLEPGAALGVRLASGDLDLTITGTLTYFKGDRFVAFGHPAFGVGETEVPVASAFVVDMMPSYFDSFKMSTAMKNIGVMTADRNWAIGGVLGKSARTVPLTMTVHSGGVTRTFHAQITRQREVLPSVAATVAMTLLDRVRGFTGEGTLRVATTVQPHDRPALERRELVYSPFDAALEGVFLAVAQPLTMLVDNDFERVPVDSVGIEVEVLPQRQSAVIRRARVLQAEAHPGDTVPIEVELEPHGQPAVTKTLSLHLPADLPPGSVRVVVSNGADAETAVAQIGVNRPLVTNIDQLIAAYARQGLPQELVLQAALPLTGAEVQGVVLPMLPPALVSALTMDADSAVRPRRDVAAVREETDWALEGRALLTLRVTPLPGVQAQRTPPPPPPPPDESSDDESALPFDLSGAPVTVAAGDEERHAVAAPKPLHADDEAADGGKPLARQPKTLTHSAAPDFLPGRFENLALLPQGGLTLQPPAADLATLPDATPWAVARRGDDIFVGGATSGTVYRINAAQHGGPAEMYFKTGELSVTALVVAADGTLYAGTAPNGRVFRITGAGTGAKFADLDATYVWDLLPRADGTLLAATGSKGVVFSLAADGSATPYYATGATHALRLAAGDGGVVYVGTAFDGAVHRVTGRGQGGPVFSSSDLSVSALAAANGRLFVGTSPRGRVYDIGADGVAALRNNPTRPTSVYALAPDGDRGVLVAIGPEGAVLSATADGTTVRWKPGTGQVIGLAGAGDGLVAVATGPSRVVSLTASSAGTREGRYESQVLDAGVTAQWAWVSWLSQEPTGSQVYLQTRSGDTPQVGAQWSDWSSPYRVPHGQRIGSPPGRFLQYRIVASAGDGGAAPIVRQVKVSYLQPNTPPEVRVTAPGGGAYWSGKQTVKWTTRDADGDTVTVTVQYSKDQGATWMTLAEAQSGPNYEWDTTALPDGDYLLRLTASDELSNAAGARTGVVVTPVVIDNTDPSLLVSVAEANLTGGDAATIKGQAGDTWSGVAGVNYKVDDGAWRAVPLNTADLFGALAPFEFRTPALAAGEHTITLRVYDVAGNSTEQAVTVKVKKSASKPE